MPLSSTTAEPRVDPQCLLDFPIELALRPGLRNTIRQNQHQPNGNSSSFTLSHIKHQMSDARKVLDENAFYSPETIISAQLHQVHPYQTSRRPPT